MAVARECQRVGAVQHLVAGWDVHLGVLVLAGHVHVVVALVDRHVDAVELVHQVTEALEVDGHQVVWLDVGCVLDRLQRQLVAAVGVGGVDLVDAVAGDGDVQIARQRQQRDVLGAGIDPHQHQRVRPRPAGGVSSPEVGADHQRNRRGVTDRQLRIEAALGSVHARSDVADVVDQVVRPPANHRRHDQHQRNQRTTRPQHDPHPPRPPPLQRPGVVDVDRGPPGRAAVRTGAGWSGLWRCFGRQRAP